MKYVLPIEKKYWDRVTQTFLNPNKMYKTNHHIGVDFATPVGTPIYAPTDGSINPDRGIRNGYYGGLTVRFLSKIDGRYYGFRFMHLSSAVRTGDFKAGEIIGYTGNSGVLTTGAHLHIDLWKGGIINLSILRGKESIESNLLDAKIFINDLMGRNDEEVQTDETDLNIQQRAILRLLGVCIESLDRIKKLLLEMFTR